MLQEMSYDSDPVKAWKDSQEKVSLAEHMNLGPTCHNLYTRAVK